jgi:iron complex outermembrane receptor protein
MKNRLCRDVGKSWLVGKFFMRLCLGLSLVWLSGSSADTAAILPEVAVIGESWQSLPAVDADGVERIVNFGAAWAVSEVLTQVLGIQVQRQGGVGSFATLTLRGASSAQVAVYLDGLLLNAQGLGLDVGKIPVSQLEAIEVYKSEVPILLSGVRIGGAVNLITRSDAGRSIILNLGDFGQRGGSITAQGSLGLLHVLWQAADNDFTFTNDQGTAFTSADDQKERRRSAAFRRYDLLWKQRLGAWDFALSGQQQQQALPRRDNRPSAARLESDQWLFSTRRPLSSQWALTAAVLWEALHYQDTARDIGLLAVDNRYRRYRYDLALDGQKMLGNWQMQWRWLIQQENFARDLTFSSQKQKFSENFVELSWQAMKMVGAWQWTPTLRLQYQEQAAFLPQLAVAWQGEKQLWRFTLGRYQRLPSLSERFGDQGFLLANPELQAETGYRGDILWQVRLTPTFSYDIGFFASEINDVIVYTYNARGLGKPENLASASILGVEARLLYGSRRWGRWQLAATWQDATARSPQPAIDGKRLPGRFEKQVLMQIDYPLTAAWQLEYRFLYEEGIFYDSPNLLPAPVKRLHDFSLLWQEQNWQVRASLLNAFNAEREDFNGFPGSGREWRLQVQRRF